MVKKCEAKYKNLNLIQSFSEQGYATIQWANQNCMNDEWLRQQVDKLSYLSPPAIRHYFKATEFVDDANSWGYSKNNNGKITFSTQTKWTHTVDFSDESLIDMEKTTASIVTTPVNKDLQQLPDLADNETYEEKEGTDEIVEIHECILPTHDETTSTSASYNYSTKNYSDNDKLDSAWYIGYNQSSHYHVRPDWLKNWRDYEIPSVCRCQTFKAKKTGVLESVSLPLEYNGASTNSNAGSPLYIQIWSTYKKVVKKTKWSKKTKKAEYEYIPYNATKHSGWIRYKQLSSGKNTGKWVKDANGTHVRDQETIAFPGRKNEFNNQGKINKTDARYYPLAQAIYDPTKQKSKGMFPTITFDKPCKVKKGYSYAIVLFSPLSDYKHCPRWAGWTRGSSTKGSAYADGSAFYSEDNGYSWERYAPSNSSKTEKLLGKSIPQDFGFATKIRVQDNTTTTNTYYNEGTYYLYLKPIIRNPMTTVSLSANDEGDTLNNPNGFVSYQYSIDGVEWFPINDNQEHTLPKASRVLLIRALLWRTNGDDYKNSTPHIQSITVHGDCMLPDEMYVRSLPYTPRMGEIMGASIWGRVYAPFTTEDSTECSVEIIEQGEMIPIDHFTLIDIEDVYSMMANLSDKESSLDYNTVANYNIGQMADYLVENPQVLEVFKKHFIYVLPELIDDSLYKFSFTPTDSDGKLKDMKVTIPSTDADYNTNKATIEELSGIQFNNKVASPIISCMLNAEGSGETYYTEWLDYTFDYTKNELVFTLENLLEMINGNLQVEYNRVFIDNLTNVEVGVREDSETGLVEEGLILDYFKETIKVDASQVASRRIPLRASPVDPIREVVLNRDTDDERQCYENRDYTIDVYTNELVFEVSNDSEKLSVLKENDILEIVYTPNLNCNSICIGYHAKRTDTSKQVSISDNYIEYKT